MEQIDPRHLLVKVTGLLERLGISYLITGGMAVFVWGRPRFTADIDIIINFRPNDLNNLAAGLNKLSNFSYVSEEAMQRTVITGGEFNFIDGESGIKVDFWVLKNDNFSKSQLARRKLKRVLSEKVYFVSPEDLILNKLLWHKESESSKQLEDIESVLKIQKKLDWKYLRKWAEKQSTLSILNSIRHEATR